jgi:hypothetical protein
MLALNIQASVHVLFKDGLGVCVYSKGRLCRNLDLRKFPSVELHVVQVHQVYGKLDS